MIFSTSSDAMRRNCLDFHLPSRGEFIPKYIDYAYQITSRKRNDDGDVRIRHGLHTAPHKQ